MVSSYKDPAKQKVLAEEIAGLVQKNALEEVRDTSTHGFYPTMFLVTKKTEDWCPIIDVSVLNPFLDIQDFQNGIGRIHQSLTPSGMVDLLHRPARCLFPCTNPPSLSHVHEDILPRHGLSIKSPAVWSIPNTLALHQGDVKSEGYGTWEWNSAPPVPRQLVGEGCYPGGVSEVGTSSGQASAVPRLGGEFS